MTASGATQLTDRAGLLRSHGEFVQRWNRLSADKQQYLRRALLEHGPGNLPIVPRPADAVRLPLSSGQRRLWFLDQMASGSSFYNMHASMPVPAKIDIAALERSLTEIVRRHEVLRTVFRATAGEPEQIVLAAEPVKLRVTDVPSLASDAASQAYTTEAQAPFDLTRGPLMRVCLLRVINDESWLLVTMHHIISDGWSLDIFLRELNALYECLVSGMASPLEDLPVQYADYALWQQSWMQGDSLERELTWWRGKLVGAATLELPADHPRPAVATFAGATATFVIPGEVHTLAQQLARAEAATSFMVYAAAFKAMLARYTGQADIIVGCPTANRNRPELEESIGFFVNTLVLRTDLSGDPTFRELVARVRQTAVEAYAHDHLPFERLVEDLHPDRDPSRNPLFQVSFQLYPVADAGAVEDGSGEVRGERGASMFDLALNLYADAHRVAGVVEFSTDLFEQGTIDRLVGHFRSILEGGLREPELRLSKLPLLTQAELDLFAEWNATRVNCLDAPVHEQVLRAAQESPLRTAIAGGDRAVTYGELRDRAVRLAARLRSCGVTKGSRVALVLPRSADLIVAELAALCAGAAFVPLDPSAPAERVLWMIEDSGAQAVITRSGTAPRVEVPTLFADADSPDAAAELTPVDANDVAYVIYTSGSTGHPKGVEIPHRGLANLVNWHRRVYEVTSGDRAAVAATPSFDASVWEIWPYLVGGATLDIVDDAVRAEPLRLWRWLAERKATIAFSPTPLAEALLAENIPSNLKLRALLTGGDRMRRAPSRQLPFRLFNNYGPTECSVVATACEVLPGESGAPPIGGPIDNIQARVVDPNGNAQPIGVPGELWLAGDGLARGYLRRPELTDERFIPDPADSRVRWYRTGDRVRYRADGTLDFLGRIDDQIQLRGYRIERGEIESTILAHQAVRQCFVDIRPAGDEQMLVAWVATSATPAQLRTHAQHLLPAYMQPSVFIVMDSLPLTANGKIDSRALPEPRQASRTERRPPRDTVEQTLADIWKELLRVPDVGLDDDFFALGGHSLLAARLLSQIRERLHLELPLTRIFRSPTLERLAECLRNPGVQPSEPPITSHSDVTDVGSLSDKEVDALLVKLLANHEATS